MHFAGATILVTKVLTKSDVEMRRIVLPRLAVQASILPNLPNKKGPNDVVRGVLAYSLAEMGFGIGSENGLALGWATMHHTYAVVNDVPFAGVY
jgi:hypothetical protein